MDTVAESTSGVNAPTMDDVRICRKWSRFFRERGFNPLPSRPDEKRPFIRYSEYWDRPYPQTEFERFVTGNVQLMTGRRWGLVVIDLDGPEAVAHWPTMGPRTPRTWITHSGGNGRHLWFAVPAEGPEIPSGRIWGIWDADHNDGKGDWRKHVAVEILGDRKLVMAPPSIHPVTGKRYRFVSGCSPREIARPATLPGWVLGLPRLKAPRVRFEPTISIARKAPVVPVTGRWDRGRVLDAIGDKIALSASWGLRFASTRPNGSGWCSVHAIGREDRSPSASFNPRTGQYWEPESGAISFFDLAVVLGGYRDWRDARDRLGETYCPHLKGA